MCISTFKFNRNPERYGYYLCNCINWGAERLRSFSTVTQLRSGSKMRGEVRGLWKSIPTDMLLWFHPGEEWPSGEAVVQISHEVIPLTINNTHIKGTFHLPHCIQLHHSMASRSAHLVMNLLEEHSSPKKWNFCCVISPLDHVDAEELT